MSLFSPHVRQGALTALPLVIPAIPFALVFGIVVESSGIAAWVGWSSSPIIFGGAAQITLITLLGEGASIAAAVTAALIVGARHLLYSVTMAPHFKDQPLWFRWLGPYVLIDQVFALMSLEHHDDPDVFRQRFLAIGFTFWAFWVVATAIGIVIGPLVPGNWNIAFAAPVLFMGLLATGANDWRKVLVAIVAGVMTALLADMPNKGGLLVGALVGIALGAAMERLQR
ncbi:MAG: AzlC family ABC transporter permease [Halieaceae bacterium]|jgi:4-azaleucine resistance transporter AzlC|nr:AzlC family ABC transporter permease [Halieaceae bacterium]